MTAVDLDHLDSGAQYEVQVIALVQNREGSPVSVRITTRESYLSYKFQLLSNLHILGVKYKKCTANPHRCMYCNLINICFLQRSCDGVNWSDLITVKNISLFSWCRHPLSPNTHHSSTGSRGYPEFCAACVESFTGCHRVHSEMGR